MKLKKFTIDQWHEEQNWIQNVSVNLVSCFFLIQLHVTLCNDISIYIVRYFWSLSLGSYVLNTLLFLKLPWKVTFLASFIAYTNVMWMTFNLYLLFVFMYIAHAKPSAWVFNRLINAQINLFLGQHGSIRETSLNHSQHTHKSASKVLIFQTDVHMYNAFNVKPISIETGL